MGKDVKYFGLILHLEFKCMVKCCRKTLGVSARIWSFGCKHASRALRGMRWIFESGQNGSPTMYCAATIIFTDRHINDLGQCWRMGYDPSSKLKTVILTDSEAGIKALYSVKTLSRLMNNLGNTFSQPPLARSAQMCTELWPLGRVWGL